MSKNIVDAVLQLNRTDIGLLPSRRQVDFDGGYVGWNTETFSKYVDKKVVLERDHGGEGQGRLYDDGKDSYRSDALHMDIVHVDPWKTCLTREEGLKKTLKEVMFVHNLNPKLRFEVGTEQALFTLSSSDLRWFLTELRTNLPDYVFEKIEYVVIQSGVHLDVVNEKNVGRFNLQKLIHEVSLCKDFGKKSKEHNGDFLNSAQRKIRFENGLSAINIGPELSIFENSLYIQHLSKNELDEYNKICYDSGVWKKWITNPEHENIPNIFMKVCGHYNYYKMILPEIGVVELLKEKILHMVNE
jgi:hypothetical protein